MREFLLICNRPARGSNANTILEHIESIHQMPGFRVWELSTISGIPELVNLDQFDAIGIHYSIHLSDPNDHFLPPRSIERLARYHGHKCIWLHDEYRRTNAVIDKIRQIGINTIFTVIPAAMAELIYSNAKLPNTKVVTVLTGYVSSELEEISVSADNQRPVDVSYRARRPPFWLGELAQDKIRIGEFFLDMGRNFNLVMDVSVEEADRLYGRQWLDLLLKSRASLSSESGASICDFSGEVERNVENYISCHPQSKFEDVRHITDQVDNVYVINCISPRIFEMAACRTVIIAFPGEYSGIIKPWVHYLPLEKDFSNFTEIVKALKNEELCRRIIARVHQDIIESGNYRYETFSLLCANTINVPERTLKTFSRFRFLIGLYTSPTYVMHNVVAKIFQKYILASSLRAILLRAWAKLPRPTQQLIKPLLRVIGR